MIWSEKKTACCVEITRQQSVIDYDMSVIDNKFRCHCICICVVHLICGVQCCDATQCCKCASNFQNKREERKKRGDGIQLFLFNAHFHFVHKKQLHGKKCKLFVWIKVVWWINDDVQIALTSSEELTDQICVERWDCNRPHIETEIMFSSWFSFIWLF